MPKIGLSGMYVAKYNNAGDIVTYTDGLKYGRAREYSTSITASDGNDYYADNAVAETQNGRFVSGTVDITSAEVTMDIEEYIHGLQVTTTTIGEADYEEILYGDDAKPPYVGWGCIEKYQIHNQDKWGAIVFPKLEFQFNDENSSTEEEERDYEDTTKTATIMRDDTINHNWKRKAAKLFDTEAEADAYIRAVLNITDEEPEA